MYLKLAVSPRLEKKHEWMFFDCFQVRVSKDA